MKQVTPDNFEEMKQSIILDTSILLIGACFVAFIIFNSIDRDLPNLTIDVSMFILLIILFFLRRRNKHIDTISTVFAYSLCLAASFWFYSGGIENTGAIFIIGMPMPIIFLMGRQRGTVFTIIIGLLFVVSYYMFRGMDFFPDYHHKFVVRVFFIYLLVLIFSFAFETTISALFKSFCTTYYALRERNKEFKDVASTREKLISSVAHDFRGQSGTLFNMCDLINSRYDSWTEEHRKKIIASLRDLAEKNYNFCDSLLKWATIQHGQFPLTVRSNNVYDTINTVLLMFKERLEEKQLSVICNCPSSLFYYYDNDTICSVLRNLLSNAIKFSGIGKSITISVDDNEHGLMVKVIDYGVGIKYKDFDRIFKSDELFSTNGTSQEHGSGFGLLLSKEFVEMNGGAIGFTSVEEQGSTFYFTLPISHKCENPEFENNENETI